VWSASAAGRTEELEIALDRAIRGERLAAPISPRPTGVAGRGERRLISIVRVRCYRFSMERPSVEVRVGGQTFRLVASAGADEVERLATIVDGKLREMHATTAFHPQSMLLVAMTLAHELEQERARRREVEQRSREMLRALLDRVDEAIDLVPEPARTEAAAPQNPGAAPPP
jgi:cell division protein ZapA